jgi:hypothetical protein
LDEQSNQDRIEIAIVAAMQQAITAVNKTNTNLKQTTELLKTVKVTADSIGNVKGITVTAREINKATSNTNKLNSSLSTTRRLLNVGFNLGKLYLLWNVTKRIRDTFVSWIESSVNFIETTNKFEVAMGSMANSAYGFQRRLSEAFGTVTTEMMNFQATFKNIMSSLPRFNK